MSRRIAGREEAARGGGAPAPRSAGSASRVEDFQTAWALREQLHGPKRGDWPALRVFHGPGEGSTRELGSIAVDLYGDHAWVTCWDESHAPTLDAVAKFYAQKGLGSAVVLERPKQGVPEEPRTLFGEAPEGRYLALEGPARYLIQLKGARHPGLFLDHAPLRQWLHRHAGSFKTALNTFAYTGSLSVACGGIL